MGGGDGGGGDEEEASVPGVRWCLQHRAILDPPPGQQAVSRAATSGIGEKPLAHCVTSTPLIVAEPIRTLPLSTRHSSVSCRALVLDVTIVLMRGA